MNKKLDHMFKDKIKITQPTCPWWFIFTFDNPFRKLYQNPSKILAPHISPGDRVADIGCGMGYFSIPMAELVGDKGKVIAVDLQAKMLAGLRRRADKKNVLQRILLQQCSQEQIGINGQIDFALAFWMVHEVRDSLRFLKQIYAALRTGGRLLIAEPYLHVSAKKFKQIQFELGEIDFISRASPTIGLSRTLLVEKD